MPCTITIAVLSESQEGDIGDDWKYSLQAKVYRGALQGQDAIEVPKHNLKTGTSQAPPGPPAAIVIPAGDSGDEINVQLRLVATEVDFLKNDSGEKTVTIPMTCPDPGAPPVVDEREITAGVTEAPTGMGNAVLTLQIRLELANA